MTTPRRNPSRSRSTAPHVEEPASITKAAPGSASYEEKQTGTPERIGHVLKRLREARGDDLQYIADYLCIRRNFLVALEESHYDELPADAYVIGFLRSYASYLGIDGKEAIDRYRSEMTGRRKKPELVLPTPISEGRTPSAIIMAGAVIAALLIYAVWYGVSSSDRTAVSKPPALPTTTVPETSASSAAPGSDLATTAAQAPNNSIPNAVPLAPPPSDSGIMLSSAAPAATTGMAPALATTEATTSQSAMAPPSKADKKAAALPPSASASAPDILLGGQVAGDGAKDTRISIRATQSSWVLITDSHGQAILDRVMKPGEVYHVPNKTGLNMTAGNANGVILMLDGAELPRLASGSSHVMRNILLDPDRLRTMPPASDE